MYTRRLLVLVPILLCSASAILAADVTGRWKGQMEGTDRETTITLKADGPAITGTMSGPEDKDHPLKGTVDADKISFVVDSEWQGNPVKLILKGTISGDEMKLSVSTEDGAWTSSITAKRI